MKFNSTIVSMQGQLITLANKLAGLAYLFGNLIMKEVKIVQGRYYKSPDYWRETITKNRINLTKNLNI